MCLQVITTDTQRQVFNLFPPSLKKKMLSLFLSALVGSLKRSLLQTLQLRRERHQEEETHGRTRGTGV